jgi:hypothetical protein
LAITFQLFFTFMRSPFPSPDTSRR